MERSKSGDQRMTQLTGGKTAALALAVAALAIAAPVLAQSGRPNTALQERADALKKLSECRQIADPAQRLACYDAAAAAIDSAEQAGDLVVVDRGQVRAAKRSLFGFDTSALNIFDRGAQPEVVDNVTLTVDRAFRGSDGKWVLVMTDGQTWRQIDSEPVSAPPKRGTKAEVRRAALGSYFMNLDGQRAIRARREK